MGLHVCKMTGPLTTVLDVESELEALLWLSADAGGTLLQNSRESSESNQPQKEDISQGERAGNMLAVSYPTYPVKCSPEEKVHRWHQHTAASGTWTALGSNTKRRGRRVGSNGSGRAEPGGLEGPPETRQLPRHGRRDAEV